MIRLIVGLPGSGKTYFAVHEILSINFNFDREFYRYVPKDPDLTIFTNIDNLKLPCVSLPLYLKSRNLTVEQFFTVDFQKRLLEKYKKIIYLIDEAQKYFPKKFYNEDVFFFFQYHRHLGIDIYLITQSSSLLPTHITSLVEYEIQAVRQTNRFRNIFQYKLVSNGEVIGRKSLKADKLIFSLYTSFVSDSPLSSRNPAPLRKYIFLFSFLILLAVVSFYFFIHSFFPTSKSSHNKSFNSSKSSVKLSTVSHSSSTLPSSNFHKSHTVSRRAPVNSVAHTRKYSFWPGVSPVKKVNYNYIPKPLDKYIVVKIGGVWDDKHRLIFLNLQGHLVPVQEFPFHYFSRGCCKTVLVWLPEKYFKNSIYASAYSSSRVLGVSQKPGSLPTTTSSVPTTASSSLPASLSYINK